MIAVKIYNHSKQKKGSVELVGKADVDYSCVNELPPGSKYLILEVMDSKKSRGRVHIQVSAVPNRTPPSANSNDNGEPEGLNEAVQRAQAKISAAKPSYERFGDVLTGMNVIIKITAPLSELPLPGLKTAHEILSNTYEVLNAQKERDENVEKLALEMAQLWTILSEIRNLDMIRSMKDVLSAATEQTRTCADFLEEYAETGIIKRFVVGYFVTDERISAFQSSFCDLNDRLTRGASIQTWVVVERRFSDLAERMDLQGLTEARGASYNDARTCLADTRRKDLERILRWVDDSSGSSVYWLTGVAGCGKSTIAHTVAKVLNDSHRLGASFFFDRNDASLNNSRLFCTTIASQLARYDSSLKEAILDAIKQDPGIDGRPLPNQMGPLVSSIMKKVQLSVPLVMVIDALDESGTPDSRKELMAMLRKELPTLSAHAKILITSRDEDDIRIVLPSDASQHPHRADVKDETQTDVRLYIQAQLLEVGPRYPHLQNWPGAEDIDRLAHRADGLFIWASVACSFILDGPDQDPVAHLETIVSTDPAERARAESSLDTLYLAILRRRPIDKDNFRYFMGSIIMLKDPLAPIDLNGLLGLETKNAKPDKRLLLADGTKIRLTTCEGIIASLASILSSGGSGMPVRIVHASIFDFLVNRDRSDEFYIDMELTHHLLVDRCIVRMRSVLHRDICELRDPSKLNREFPDIDNRIVRCVPGDVMYACRFWTSHLVTIRNPTESLVSTVTDFMMLHLLHWLEVMSLLGRARDVSTMLRTILEWSKRLHLNTLTSLMRDCFHFVQEFTPMMELSALHIYISAMVFCPKGSRVVKAFHDSHSIPLPVISCAEDALITPVCSVYQGHSDVVYAMAIFPKGDKIVSAGAGPTIHIWDPSSSSLVREPIHGYEGSVLALAVSSDGNIIAASTSSPQAHQVHLWNASTGDRIGNPLPVAHRTLGITFLPGDGQLASSSDDGQLRVWNVQTGTLAREPLIGRTSTLVHVAVSPDGKIIAATSRESTELWDLTTWEPIGEPLQPGDSAVAFSPDSQRLALGRYVEHCVVLWDLTTKQFKRLDGHTRAVNATAFSPNGEVLASASSDSTIRLWNGITGEVLHTLQGHTYTMWSIEFSPDGAQLASASADKTVRIWDVESCLASGSTQPQTDVNPITCTACSPKSAHFAFSIGNVVYITSSTSVITPMRSHKEEVKFLGFSSDGSRLASASPGLLQWWDTKTATPLESVALTGTEKTRYIDMSPDNSRLAMTLQPKTVLMCSASTGEPIGEPRMEHEGWIRSVAFSPDGSWLATSADDYTIRLRDPVSGAEVGDPIRTVIRTSAIAFSPDGGHLASGSLSDATIRLWSTSSREMVWQYSGNIVGKIYKIVFTPGGDQVISAAANGATFVLDTSSGARIGKTIRCFNGISQSLALSQGGAHLFVATDTVQVWTRQKGDDAWAFRRELYPASEMSWREEDQPLGSFLASFHEYLDGWLTCEEGHKLLWIPEHLRRVWSPFLTSRLRLGRDAPIVALDLHQYLVWLSAITGTSYEVDEEWSNMPVSRDLAGVNEEASKDIA
ncbi:WD40 repeat-like protein [Obba rivulosa]|uniref:WD40 repeat-like protein n=1 Tax=Obba rivulosa TaxID=1052685 RepID=A0A8E2DK83_9APHY|nr:WD40 repeat-like protein [Obba rivulosa]